MNKCEHCFKDYKDCPYWDATDRCWYDYDKELELREKEKENK